MSTFGPRFQSRLAVFFLFVLDGVGFGAWAAYLPSYKTALKLSDGQLGVVLFGLVLGSLISMPATGRVLARRSNRTVMLIGAAAFCLSIPWLTITATGFASLPAFLAAAILFGATKGIIDVSANAYAVALEQEDGRPLLSACHGGWSLGVLLGTTAIALALRLQTPPLMAISLIALMLLGVTGLSARWLRETPRNDRSPARSTSIRPQGRLIPIAALAFLGLFCEGSIGDWATIFLVDDVHTTEFAAALGFAAYSLVMMLGRFSGDFLVNRLGPMRLLAGSGLLVSLGLGFAIVMKTYLAAVIGFAFVGLGTANMVPILFRSAGRDGDSGAAIASVSTVGYLGFLAGPPLIGALSQAIGLAAALSVVVLFGLMIAASARFVDDRPQPEADSSNPIDGTLTHVQAEPCV